jgi:hypothetical protein
VMGRDVGESENNIAAFAPTDQHGLFRLWVGQGNGIAAAQRDECSVHSAALLCLAEDGNYDAYSPI